MQMQCAAFPFLCVLVLPPKFALQITYLEKHLDVVDQCAELIMLDPAQLGDEGKELSLCCDDEWLCIWVLVDMAEYKGS